MLGPTPVHLSQPRGIDGGERAGADATRLTYGSRRVPVPQMGDLPYQPPPRGLRRRSQVSWVGSCSEGSPA